MAKRRKANYGKHVSLTEDLLTDPKWNSLSCSAKMVWILFRREYRGGHDTTLSIWPSKVNQMIKSASFWRGIRELKEIGWLEIVKHGGFPQIANEYKLKGPHAYFIYNEHKVW